MLSLALFLMLPTTNTTRVQRIAIGHGPSCTHSDTICDTNRVTGLMTTVAPSHRAVMARSVALTHKVPEALAAPAAMSNLQVATRCDEERQLNHLSCNSSRMCLGPRCFERAGVSPPNHMKA
jgi:hypothetical protein